MSKLITVNYNNSPCYNIMIEKDFANLGKAIQNLSISGKKICIVTDSNVAPLYSDEILNIIESTNNTPFIYTFNAGEENKTLDTVMDVYEYLIVNKFDRSDYLLALGGGVTGDLTGYVAATYLRGISFIQVPTTLLAQVDSSIGGKTGVDFRAYKNMIGAFHMPKLVYMNISTLNTLSERLFNSGFGEILKHGLIKDKQYFEWLFENQNSINNREYEALEHMIYQSCLIKKNVVELDPTEKGDRALLNFGHTLGHAVEKLMNFSLYHGECVVLGMICALKISLLHNHINLEEYNMCLEAFKRYSFPLKVDGITKEDVLAVSKSDKKMVSGKIKFILLNSIGDAYINMSISDEELLSSLSEII